MERRYVLDWNEFAKALGFSDAEELRSKMEKILQDDMGWFIALQPGEKWVDVAEIPLDQLENSSSKARAKRKKRLSQKKERVKNRRPEKGL